MDLFSPPPPPPLQAVGYTRKDSSSNQRGRSAELPAQIPPRSPTVSPLLLLLLPPPPLAESQRISAKNPQHMEGQEEEDEEFFASIDSLWFFSSVFLLPPPVKEKTKCPPPGPGELQPEERDSPEIHEKDGDCGHEDPGGVRKAVAPVAGGRRAAAAARGRVVEEERMDMWQEQCRQMRVAAAAAAAAPARCSPLPMPRTSDGPAMRAHLRSWAHAVACSVR
ncbi:Os01g0730600 [Oryza sativa Japonica Group]|uniref:Os01g0730600 protein n=3 Tax=Oryza sativa TaxID=4530 RepID=A0A0P0V7T3_ORYSJ|nr:Os01g0730600 [Oryza sativa Japonica Group]